MPIVVLFLAIVFALAGLPVGLYVSKKRWLYYVVISWGLLIALQWDFWGPALARMTTLDAVIEPLAYNGGIWLFFAFLPTTIGGLIGRRMREKRDQKKTGTDTAQNEVP